MTAENMTAEERVEILPRRYYSPTGAYELYDEFSNTWYDSEGEEILQDCDDEDEYQETYY